MPRRRKYTRKIYQVAHSPTRVQYRQLPPHKTHPVTAFITNCVKLAGIGWVIMMIVLTWTTQNKINRGEIVIMPDRAPITATPAATPTPTPGPTPVSTPTLVPTLTAQQSMEKLITDRAGFIGDGFHEYVKGVNIVAGTIHVHFGYRVDAKYRAINGTQNLVNHTLSAAANLDLFPNTVIVTIEHLSHRMERGQTVFTVETVDLPFSCQLDDLMCLPKFDQKSGVYVEHNRIYFCNKDPYHIDLWCAFD